MRLQVSSPTATVCLNNFGTIKGDTLERIDGDENNATIGIDTVLSITISDGMEHC
jgi:hypothetical protein